MKRAFTLIELLVYMAIMGFIIVVAGRVFSDSTNMRIRSQNLLKSSSEIGKLANLLSEDISQMGAKVWGQTIDDVYKVVVHDSVYMDAKNNVVSKRDSSSYILIGKERTESNFNDSLIFRKAVFDANGKFIAVREITWYRGNGSDSNSLFRRCRQITDKYPDGHTNADGISDNDCNNNNKPVLIATNITNFKLTPSTPTEQDTLLSGDFYLLSNEGGEKKRPGECKNYGTSTDVSGFIQSTEGDRKIYEFYLSKYNSEDCTSDISNCRQMTFKKDTTYAIEFGMRYEGYPSTQFVPGKDHLSIGLKKAGNNIPDAPSDMFFYPPQEATVDEITRHFEFATKQKIENACVAITAAFYSPAEWESAKLSFKDFKVFQKVDESFHFPKPDEYDYNPKYGIIPDGVADDVKIKEKRGVKAFELLVEMAIGKEERKAGTFSQKDRGIIISTPNNGLVVETE